jgi:sulfotransferase
MKKIFFNSSLPRAGSTLFQNIIADNPDFYCTPTSGFLELILASKQVYAQSPTFKAQNATEMNNAFLAYCKGAMDGYFNVLTSSPYVIDKNRGWGIHYSLVETFTGKAPKMVFMVRDLRAIYASMEKNFRKNPTKENHIQNPDQMIGTTLKKRIEIWSNSVPIGITMDRLRDIIDQGIDKKILFIRYEDLMSQPEIEIKRFYEYLGLPYYEGHNFETVTQHTHEDDSFHGIYGDHTLRSEFKKLPNDFTDVLGFENCQTIKQSYPWFFTKFGYV